MKKKKIKADRCAVSYRKQIKKIARNYSHSKILDIGCGTGNYTSLFSINNNEVFGIDIEDFRKTGLYNNFNFTLFDGRKIPFPDNFFDGVVNFDVIEHVEKDREFVREIKRVLKKGGSCFCSTPNRIRLSNLLRRIMLKKIEFPLVISEEGDLGKLVHIKEYSKKEIKNLFEKEDFEKIEVLPYWFGLRGQVNFGVAVPIIGQIAQYFFVKATK
jgi:2-polyprenyl-3-methyl-5-hydroxy-6-metoxy-1,4-benzoquinol methylase